MSSSDPSKFMVTADSSSFTMNIELNWVSLFSGMERWNGMVEWNGGMEWNGIVELPRPPSVRVRVCVCVRVL